MSFKFYLLLFVQVLTAQLLYSQTPAWTWIQGDTIEYQSTIYGTKGVASPQNKPGGRVFASAWADNAGNFWLFAGNEHTPGGSEKRNDLWKFNASTNEWTWVHGDSLYFGTGVYGMAGVSSPLNKPGPRQGSISWTDTAGNLWLFGGYGFTDSLSYGNLNDLWKYEPLTNEWTWMQGDSIVDRKGLYGKQGQPSATNKPGGRRLSVSWTDSSGNLWLMGGEGLDAMGFPGTLNDLWKYDPLTNQWSWMKGDSMINQASVYGTKGVAGMANKPGSRNGSVGWTDTLGRLWLFGGSGYGLSVGGLNDLWRYDPVTNMWAWMSGDYRNNQPGVYGTLGVPSAGNVPGARFSASGWSDASGDLWLFGGTTMSFDQSNDVWRYHIADNQWTWVSGDNVPDVTGVYGVQGVASATNKPGSRYTGAGRADKAGSFWLFGGFGYPATISRGYLNDLWKFSTSSVFPVRLLNFIANGQSNQILLRWTVENEINFDRYEIEKSLDGRTFSSIYSVKAKSIQEYSYTDVLTGNLSGTHILYYRLRLVNKDGTFTNSNIQTVTVAPKVRFVIYPNPATSDIQLLYNAVVDGNVEVELADAGGRVITKQNLAIKNNTITIARKHMPSGVYFITVKQGQQVQSGKVILK